VVPMLGKSFIYVHSDHIIVLLSQNCYVN